MGDTTQSWGDFLQGITQTAVTTAAAVYTAQNAPQQPIRDPYTGNYYVPGQAGQTTQAASGTGISSGMLLLIAGAVLLFVMVEK